MENEDDIRLRVKELMRLLNVNQSKFAKGCGIKQGNLSAVLKGRRKVGTVLINQIALGWNVSKKWLLTGEGDSFKSVGIISDDDLTQEVQYEIFEINKGLLESNRGLVESNKGLVESAKDLVESNKMLTETIRNMQDSKVVFDEKFFNLIDKIINQK